MFKYFTTGAALFFFGTAAIAQVPDDFAALSDKELVALLTDYEGDQEASSCSVLAPGWEELARRYPDRAEARVRALISRFVCLDTLKDHIGAAAKLGEFEVFTGQYSLNWYGLILDYYNEDSASAVKRFDRLAASSGKEHFGELSPQVFWAIVRQARKDGLDEGMEQAALSAVKARRHLSYDDGFRTAFSSLALKPAVAAGDMASVESALSARFSPPSFVQWLAQKSMEPAWPLLEERVGPNFSKITADDRKLTVLRYYDKPEDRDRISEAAHAIYFDGDFQEAIDFVQEEGKLGKPLEEMEEGDAWALNIAAYSYDALGEMKKADDIFDAISKLDRETRPWLINFVINRGSRLVGQARWEEGLAAANFAAVDSEKYGSTYARMLIARDRICALANLGRVEEAAADVSFVKDNIAEANAIGAQAYQCLDDETAAAELIVEGLADEKTREALVVDLQAVEFDVFYTSSILPHPRDLMATNADVRKAFDAVARIIPESMTPAASLKRVPLSAVAVAE